MMDEDGIRLDWEVQNINCTEMLVSALVKHFLIIKITY